ncbi:MAG: GGDEF domain-containing protein, partial [Pseudolabrys sp.]|nr:GGDEF domain-containing protein [Pseudolabrys sp.]
ADCSALPNYERLDGRPADIVRWMLPLVRLHAYEERLQRQLAAIEANGMIDPHTGLFTIVAFLRDLNRAIAETGARRATMSLARFSFLPFVDRRTNLDAARLTSKLVRSVDFACHASDGSILLAFPNTPLRDAHVIARRIANSLKGTMLGAATNNDPIVTLASFKPSDSAESLLSRVSDPAKLAAE